MFHHIKKIVFIFNIFNVYLYIKKYILYYLIQNFNIFNIRFTDSNQKL